MVTRNGKLITAAILGLGFLAMDVAPAVAAPPPHAKAWGYRAKRSSYSSYNDVDRDGIPNWRDRDIDGDGILNGRDRSPRVRNRRVGYRRDVDGDGIRNSRDRFPRIHRARTRGRGDLDGDGIRNRRDRDRDGDGIRNRRDRRPTAPRLRR